MSRNRFLCSFTLVLVLFYASGVSCQEANRSESWESREVRVEADEVLKRLLEEEDADHDKKITIDDNIGDKQFTFTDRDGQKFSVNGTAALSQLLQELTLARDKAEKPAVLSGAQVFENPVTRISRLIRERYWDNLTRRIDTEHPEDLLKILQDEKVHSGSLHYLYVPFRDEEAFQYFQRAEKQLPSLKLRVVKLPENITADYVANLGKPEQHGLLALALEKTQAGGWRGVPYVVPGGRFNEMYGWDSYFESLGLIVDGRVELAQAMVDNFVYQIEHYGKILNANRTYYLMRSQPPFLTSMIRAVYAELPKNPTTKQWLSRSLKAAMAEYKKVWMGPERLTPIGLSRYAGTGKGMPPEVEPGHFAQILKPYAQQRGLTLEQFEPLYKAGKISEPELDSFFLHDQAVRESGHDTTYRWRVEGQDRCADFVTVDLNALLYKIELDIGQLINTEFNDRFPDSPDPDAQQSKTWFERAKKRKALILKYLWDPQESVFFDYDYVRGRRSAFLSATSLYPLWAWNPDLPDTKILAEKDAEQLVHKVLSEIEMPGGVAGSSLAAVPREQTSDDPKAQRQWDYPYGWAPHQMLIWEGLRNYGFKKVADRLIYKWLYTIARNAADYNGTIPEKFNVVTRSHQVFAEYGNVGTKFSYMTREGFGWMNASLQVGLKRLSPQWQAPLKNLVPPEWLEWNEQCSLWQGEEVNGSPLTWENLNKRLEAHKKWLETAGPSEIEKKMAEKPMPDWGADRGRLVLKDANLRHVDLRDADLRYADLQKADLSGANLSAARLMGANLSEARLVEADLQKADLSGANLSAARLMGANLSAARLVGAILQKGNLWRANLSAARLQEADLSEAQLVEAILQKGNLWRANLSEAQLVGTNLQEVNLHVANLQKAKLMGADLQKADLSGATLSAARLMGANLKGAKLTGANLQNADLREAYLQDVIYEPKATAKPEDSLPDIDSLRNANNIEKMQFINSLHALEDLRQAFKKMGFREQERQVTYALKKSENTRNSIFNWLFNLLFFDLTVRYGLEPGRALVILFFYVIPFFTPIYAYALLGTVKDTSLADSTGNLNSTKKRFQAYHLFKKNKEKQNGIWQIWPADRPRKKEIGSDEPALMIFSKDWWPDFPNTTAVTRYPTLVIFKCKYWRLLLYSVLFSLLSAFNIGWRDFNIGNWIARLQSHSYTLQATGWVRRIAGLQSLISVYLLAIWVLSYFGRLFE